MWSPDSQPGACDESNISHDAIQVFGMCCRDQQSASLKLATGVLMEMSKICFPPERSTLPELQNISTNNQSVDQSNSDPDHRVTLDTKFRQKGVERTGGVWEHRHAD